MKAALLRLFIIFVSVCAFFASVVMIMNVIGGVANYAELDHPLISKQEDADPNHKNTTKYLIYNPPDYTRTTLEVPFGSSANNKGSTLKSFLIDIFYKDENFWVATPEAFQNDSNSSKESFMKLEDYLRDFPQETLAIKIYGSLQGSSNKLVDLITSFGLGERVIVFAERASTLKELRQSAPRWLFAAHQSAKTKATLLSNIFLESLVRTDFHLIVLPAAFLRDSAQLRFLKEVKRRKKVVLISTDSDSIELEPVALPFIDGLVLSRHGAQDLF